MTGWLMAVGGMIRESLEQHKTGWVRTTSGIAVPALAVILPTLTKYKEEIAFGLQIGCGIIAGAVGLAALISHAITIRWKLRNERNASARHKWHQDRNPDNYR